MSPNSGLVNRWRLYHRALHQTQGLRPQVHSLSANLWHIVLASSVQLF